MIPRGEQLREEDQVLLADGEGDGTIVGPHNERISRLM